MDPRLQEAAESGSTDELYALIDENPYILDNIDAVPFVNTPLHVAAAAGNIQFAMEVLNLKPSFARKLNTSGYSPLHLAVDEDQRDYVSWMLRLDHELALVKGRNNITPFLFLVLRGDVNLVAECLMSCSECIQDVNVNGHNALHLAVMNDRFEVLQVLTGWIQRMSQRNAFTIEISALNKKDFSYNTALHLAAYKNDHQACFIFSISFFLIPDAVRLLLECRLVERNTVNGEDLTFLDILRDQGQNAGDWDLDLEQVVLKSRCKEAASMPRSRAMSDFLKSPISFWTYCTMITKRLRSNTSEEARGAFLIVYTLIITATYQTALQPPGGGHQSEDAKAGSVGMKHTFFILLWFSNTLGFCWALFNTFCLLPLRRAFTSGFLLIATSLCVSYALAMAVNSSGPLFFISLNFAIFVLFAIYILLGALVTRKHRMVAHEPFERFNTTYYRQKRGL
ncbi:unnamed protein product [Thlaspi arvense]|uniref:PGG domain-containing protein n=1 Tax=Thlaspi arvense TaxID=13288 RepID=A0AAU9RBW2_THLAR|nr:unnamed protein product [Thlaspi arvense]